MRPMALGFISSRFYLARNLAPRISSRRQPVKNSTHLKSISDGWEQAAVLEQNVKYWQDVLALMKDEYCIDENRVFIAGVSSGGQFIEHLTCRFGDTLWQTTAVSAAVELPIDALHGA